MDKVRYYNMDAGRTILTEDDRTRATFLRSVGMWTMGGLLIAATTGALSSFVIAQVPALWNQWVMLAVIFGAMGITNYVARPMVHGSAKIPGFILGTAAEGVALGYLLLAAVLVGGDAFGTSGLGPFTLIAEAGGLTLLTAACMVGWLWTAPKDLSMIRGAMSVMFLPMIVLMVITFVFPVGGIFGMMISGLFVLISGAGLLYNLNQVLHVVSKDQDIEAAYEVSIGMLVLFWNLLSLLMRLTNRD